MRTWGSMGDSATLRSPSTTPSNRSSAVPGNSSVGGSFGGAAG